MTDAATNIDPRVASPTARLITRLNAILALIMAFVLFAMMTLVTVDVIGRNFFNTPVKGGFEIVQFLLAIIIFVSLPLITWDNGHVTVSIFEGFFKRHFTRIQQLFVLCVSALSLALITWRMWIQGIELADGKQITGFLEWPIAPIAYFMSVLSAFALVIILILIVMALAGKELPSSAPTE